MILRFQEHHKMRVGRLGFHPAIGISDFRSKIIIGYRLRVFLERGTVLARLRYGNRANADGNE